jgi:microcystin-dependent protein
MSYLIQLRNDTAANWASANPILSAGEAGFEVDTGIFKIGNGTSTWTALRETAGGPASVNPAGVISQFAGSTAPTGYLLCQGQSISTTTYSNLFAAIGYTYGGSGSSFIVPNLQNRIPVGKGTDAEFDTLGETGGAKTVTLSSDQMAPHAHSGSTGGISENHTHAFSTSGDYAVLNIHGAGSASVIAGGEGSGYGTGYRSSYRSGGSNIAGATSYDAWGHGHSHSGTTGTVSSNHVHSFTTNDGPGTSSPVPNLQPYIVVNYIIKT